MVRVRAPARYLLLTSVSYMFWVHAQVLIGEGEGIHALVKVQMKGGMQVEVWVGNEC